MEAVKGGSSSMSRNKRRLYLRFIKIYLWIFNKELYRIHKEADILWNGSEEERRAAFKRRLYMLMYGGSLDYWDQIMEDPEKYGDWWNY